MKVILETTIGNVEYRLSGNSLLVSTEKESAKSFSINIYDAESDSLRIGTSIHEIFFEVLSTLDKMFPGFGVDSIEVLQVPLEELMKSMPIIAKVASAD